MAYTEILYAVLVAGAVWLVLGTGKGRKIDETLRRLDKIERQQALIMRHFEITEPQPELSKIRALLDAGRKIEAIKEYRSLTGVGLKEAKDAVEAL